ncbi:NAD(P)-dependent alcohol dehydrogenase [Candidatus Neomarinimicrobiota bacterium]
MKAAVVTKYGPPDVLELQEVDKPAPKDDEVLVKVHATTAGPADWHFRSGTPFLARILAGGLRKPKVNILGFDIAGEIESVGRDVSQFSKGDQVYGMTIFGRNGANAEYVCTRAGSIQLKPANLSFEEAAAIPSAAGVSLLFLRAAGIRNGQTVLINGASGALGTSAVQLAKHYDTHVTAVCSTANVELVKSLGADAVIDYTQEDFIKSGQTYDLIFDAVAKRSFPECRNSLNSGGVYMTTVSSLRIILYSLLTAVAGNKKAKFMMPMIKPEDIAYIHDLVEAGKVKPVIDKCYPLREVAEAHRYSEAGHAKGRIVVKVAGTL